MNKYMKLIITITLIFLVTGCNKLYSYKQLNDKCNKKIAYDLVIDDSDSFDRKNGLRMHTAYLNRNKYRKFNIINGQEYLLPISNNFLCTNFADVYLLPEYKEFERKYKYNYKELYNIKVETKQNGLHPKCSNLKITINCDNKEHFYLIDKYIEYLNKDGIYLNRKGLNRYDIYCQDGSEYTNDL